MVFGCQNHTSLSVVGTTRGRESITTPNFINVNNSDHLVPKWVWHVNHDSHNHSDNGQKYNNFVLIFCVAIVVVMESIIYHRLSFDLQILEKYYGAGQVLLSSLLLEPKRRMEGRL